jgi:hypothetical protein
MRATHYTCGTFDRIPFGTPYPAIVAVLCKRLIQRSLRDRTTLVCDATSIGAPVVDCLQQEGLSPVAVTITGGDAVTWR